MSLLDEIALVKDRWISPLSESGELARNEIVLANTAGATARLHDLTVLHMDDPVGLGGQFVVMSDDDEGCAAGLVQFTHHGEERFARVRIQISRRLISQYEIWFLQKGTCDRYALLFTA